MTVINGRAAMWHRATWRKEERESAMGNSPAMYEAWRDQARGHGRHEVKHLGYPGALPYERACQRYSDAAHALARARHALEVAEREMTAAADCLAELESAPGIPASDNGV